MISIRESRYAKIENKVVTLEGVHRLAQVINAEYLKTKLASQHASISFMAKCFDNSSFESEDVSLFSSDSVLNSKRIASFEISYYCYDVNAYVKIDLAHGDSSYGNSITITGTESTWVNGIMKKLEEIVNSFRPQNRFVKNHRFFVNSVLALSLGVVFTWIIRWVVSIFPPEPTTNISQWEKLLSEIFERVPIVRVVFRCLIGYPVGYFPALFITDKLSSLWPSIEIQVGPEHTFIEKKRRNWVISVILLGILPLLVSIVYDLIKRYIF